LSISASSIIIVSTSCSKSLYLNAIVCVAASEGVLVKFSKIVFDVSGIHSQSLNLNTTVEILSFTNLPAVMVGLPPDRA
jgi:hypothetical protein